jgi:hypothetical protein
MSNAEAESLMTLKAACRHPLLRNPRTGRPAHASTIFRYAIRGARAIDGSRVKLPVTKLPSGLCTTDQGIRQFVEQLTNPGKGTTAPRTAARQRQIARSEQELQKAGML